ncbi:hypothetical protein SFUMM280S_02366 [Streptomyces fumanus]
MTVDGDGDPQVVAAGLLVGVVQVRQQRVGPLRGRDPRVLQGVQRSDPRGDGGGEGLAEERAEGDVLPRLDVPRGPVVEQAEAEHVLAPVGERHRPAEPGGHTDDETDLGLDVQPDGRPEDGRGVGGSLALPAGAYDVRAGDHHRAGAAVVADREVLPVRRQGVGGVGAEDPADVPGVVLGGVEVDVVGDLEGQVQGDRGQGVEQRFEGRAVGGDRHPGRQRAPDVGPGGAPGRQQRVEVLVREQGGVRRSEGVGRRAGVEDVVTEPDAHPPLRRAGVREHAVRKVVRAEGVALGDIEGGHRVLPRFRVRRVRGRAARATRSMAGPHVTAAAAVLGRARGGGAGREREGPERGGTGGWRSASACARGGCPQADPQS